MSRFVRQSKYRHVFGNRSKVNYENAKISGSAWDTDLVTAGGKYIAVNWQVSGGGAFAILPTFSPFTPPAPAGFPSKLPDRLPLARGHTAPVLDTAWSPFDDNLVASGGEDGKIFLWNIDDSVFEGWHDDDWEPVDFAPAAKLNAGGRKVGQVVFHPTAQSVLASASGDHIVRIWDIEEGQDAPNVQLTGHKDSVQSLAWNSIGTILATTCRDRKLRLFDPRAGTEAVRVVDGHGGLKGSRVVWLGDRDRIATTGFSRMSDRQVGLWDTGDLRNISTTSIDSSAGIMIPFFAEGNNILFLSGKGDGNIRYYEYDNDEFYFLNEYKTSDPQRGMGFVPRRALDTSQNEIARSFKLSGGGIDPLSFIVPRKAEGFQSDIFPPANSIEPALQASEWFAGKTARPNLVDLETHAASVNRAPIPDTPFPAGTPVAKPSTPVASTPVKKEVPKEEPRPVTPPAPVAQKIVPPEPKLPETKAPEPEPVQEAKSLEIEQPDEDSEEEVDKIAAVGVASAAGVATGAAVAAASTSEDRPVPQPPSDHLLVKLLSDKGTVPTRGSALSAGYDLHSAESVKIPAGGRALVDLQLSIAVPAGTYGRIAPRSGLAAKHGIDVGAGVVDADYRGPVKVLLYNLGSDEFSVSPGDRIAQLILEKIHVAPIRRVEDLDETTRGAGGFGSTGGFGARS